MLPGVILLGLGALLLYQGFTGNSAVAEIQKMLSGQAAFGRSQVRLVDRIAGSEVVVGNVSPIVGPDGNLIPGLAPKAPSPPPDPASPGGGGGSRFQ